MPRRHAILDISASGVALALCRGTRVERAESVAFDRADWPTPWTDALAEVGEAAASLVVRLGAGALPTLVVASVPGSVCLVSRYPLNVRPRAAADAARLELLSAGAGPVQGDPCAARALRRDPADVAGGAQHVGAVGVRAEALEALRALAARAGLRVDGVTLADAVGAAEAIAAVPDARADAREAVLWLGQHGSVLAVGAGGALAGVRLASLGLGALAEALTRPMRRAGDGAAAVTLSRAQARALLTDVGLPRPDQDVPGYEGMRGSAVLVQLQPVLQRLSVDVKQALRFAARPGAPGVTALRLLGPGAGMPGLGAALADFIGVSLAGAPDAEPAPLALLAAAARRAGALPVLPAPEALERARGRRLRAATLAGSLCALGLIGAEWAGVESRSAPLRQRVAALAQAAPDLTPEAAVALSALRQSDEATNAHRALSRAAGDRPHAAGVLAAVAHSAGPGVRLTELVIDAPASPARLHVRGAVHAPTPDAASERIGAFVSALSANPLFASVRLAGTRRAPDARADAVALAFDVEAEIVALPSGELARLAEVAP